MTETLTKTFDLNWPFAIAQILNLILVIFLISLPFILWANVKRRREKLDQRLLSMQQQIDNLKMK